ncbi:MAG: tRNA (guanosine(37)-N1)-methyltransferase TrmD [Verrucomicrobiota bacterium]
MRIDILTLFPAILDGALQSSILARAQKTGAVKIHVHQLRDYAHDKHKTVDDRPFGGGPGMVMKCEPLVEAIEAIQAMDEQKAKVIYLTPQGKTLKQPMAVKLSKEKRLLLVSGHYEGIDDRVREGGWIDEEISIGDYVLTNGTIAALVLMDCVVRLLPGTLGNEDSASSDSFGIEGGWLEGPQYTRPEIFQNLKVPEILLSGHHAEIENWRREKALERTLNRRSDLIKKG